MKPFNITFGEVVDRAPILLKDLAERTGLSPSTLSAIRTGVNFPKIDTFLLIFNALEKHPTLQNRLLNSYLLHTVPPGYESALETILQETPLVLSQVAEEKDFAKDQPLEHALATLATLATKKPHIGELIAKLGKGLMRSKPKS